MSKLVARHLSLVTALAALAASADPATNAPVGALVMRHHGVLPLIIECAQLSKQPLLVPFSDHDCGEWGFHTDTEPFDFDEWIKSYAGVRGVAWPAGSSAHYVPAFGRIEVLNTEENQTREVGNILDVTPSLTPDGTRIVLDIVPTVVFPPEWRDYPAAPLAPGGAATALPEPFFPVFSLALSLDVKRGNTVALGGALLAEPGKGERFQLFFVNADVVDLDGVPIPAP